MDRVIISERFSSKSFGTRAAVDVTFDNTDLQIITGTEVQTALVELDGATAAAAIAAGDAQVSAGEALEVGTAAQLRADQAYDLAEDALAAAGSGGEVFAFFLS